LDNYDALFTLTVQRGKLQEKFVYYLGALCVAAIGFSINQTINESLNYFHVFVGIAVTCWSISILCGFQYIKVVLQVSARNIQHFQELNDPKSTPKTSKEALSDISKELDQSAVRNFNWQQRLFYLGLVTFVTWHILRMSAN
jgi:hypothetical protein